MKTLQFVGGTTAQNDPFVGAERMLTVDSERWELRLHDGETPGGHRILNLEQLKLIFMQLTSEFGGVAFSPDARGFLVRVGNKQYALRKLVEGTGINLTNPDGVDGDVTIAIDESWLNSLSFTANSIAYGGQTQGVAASLTLTLPANWPNANGSCAFFSFHVAPADGATLSVNGADPVPLLTPMGSNLLTQVAGVGTRVLMVKDGAGYYLVGMQRAAEIGIDTIAGLAADNVQEALEALLGKISGIGPTPSSGVYYKFTNYGQVPVTDIAALGMAMPLADGEYRLINCQARPYTERAGGSSGSSTVRPQFININGIGLASTDTWGIISRKGNALRFSPQVPPFSWTADSRILYGSDFTLGNVAPGATTVIFQARRLTPTGDIGGINDITLRFSDAGTVAA